MPRRAAQFFLSVLYTPSTTVVWVVGVGGPVTYVVVVIVVVVVVVILLLDTNMVTHDNTCLHLM